MRTKVISVIALFLLLAGCSNNKNKPDAYGNFEAVEVVISAEGTGKLLRFTIDEGLLLKAGDTIGYIDTTQLYLQKAQLKASITALQAKLPNIPAQINVLNEQLATAEHELRRVENLVKLQAATTKQLDDATAQVSVIKKQITATRSSLDVQSQGLLAEIDPLRAQIKRIDDMISRSIIINPINGTVLSKYAQAHEIATTGKPLYKIANISEITLRAYVGEEQLPEIKLGQQVKVFIDIADGESKSNDGTITWIADKAEFTPKVIQTKNERINLVYAVKISVKNNGSLKIGMPAEVRWSAE